MNFTVFCIAFLAMAVSVLAQPTETNAQRMARGLPPLPPARRWTGVQAARRSTPSGSPGGSCNSGPVQCCNSVETYDQNGASLLSNLLGITIPVGIPLGFQCSPISVIGTGGNSCSSQPVCCENNDFSGGISLGCSPVNIG